MREYLFRGWDATGQKGWVYGDLTHSKGISRDDEEDLYDRIMVGGYHVDENTVGQFTGIYDKNGVRIFEDDMVVKYNKTLKTQKTGVIVYNSKIGCYRFQVNEGEWISRSDLISSETVEDGNAYIDMEYEYEVVGNIFEK